MWTEERVAAMSVDQVIGDAIGGEGGGKIVGFVFGDDGGIGLAVNTGTGIEVRRMWSLNGSERYEDRSGGPRYLTGPEDSAGTPESDAFLRSHNEYESGIWVLAGAIAPELRTSALYEALRWHRGDRSDDGGLVCRYCSGLRSDGERVPWPCTPHRAMCEAAGIPLCDPVALYVYAGKRGVSPEELPAWFEVNAEAREG